MKLNSAFSVFIMVFFLFTGCSSQPGNKEQKQVDSNFIYQVQIMKLNNLILVNFGLNSMMHHSLNSISQEQLHHTIFRLTTTITQLLSFKMKVLNL